MSKTISGVVVNADDFGYSDSVNRAITQCLKNNLISQTTVMVNMPGFAQACQLSKEHGFENQVGLHLNLSEGEPLTDRIKSLPMFCDNDGRFNGAFRRSRRFTFFMSSAEKKAVKEEVEAQMKQYIGAGFMMMHMDSHHHTHTIPSILAVVIPLAKENGFRSMRISRNVYGGNGGGGINCC